MKWLLLFLSSLAYGQGGPVLVPMQKQIQIFGTDAVCAGFTPGGTLMSPALICQPVNNGKPPPVPPPPAGQVPVILQKNIQVIGAESICSGFVVGGTPTNPTLTCKPIGPPGPINCPGFAVTRVYDWDWNEPRRVNTGNIGQNDAIVIRFTTPPNNTQPYSDVTGAEYGGPQTTRYATLSPTACDFGEPPALGWSAASNGSTVYLKFTVGPNSSGYYPALNKSQQYFVNVKTTANCNNCSMIFDLHK